jgi:hypothetical protein
MTNTVTAMIFGFLGGVAAEGMALYKLRQCASSQYPDYLSTFRYWVPTIFMTIMGGALAGAYALDGAQLGTILSMNIGASAPLIVGNWTKEIPKISETGSHGRGSRSKPRNV